MWATLAKLWISISLALETINSATRTVNNLVTTAEEHSANFKAVSMAELRAKQAKAEAKSARKISSIGEATA